MSQNARLDPNLSGPALSAPSLPSPARAGGSARSHDHVGETSSGVLGRLSVGQKLALAGLLLGAPFVGTLAWEIHKSQQDVQLIHKQQAGQTMLKPLTTVLQNTQLLRLSSVNILSDSGAAKATAKKANAAQRAALKGALNQLTEQLSAGGYLELGGALERVKEIINVVNRGVDTNLLTPAEAQKTLSDMLRSFVVPLFADVANQTGLKQTNDVTQAMLADLVTNTMPQNMPAAGTIASGTVSLLRRLGPVGSSIGAGLRSEAQLRWDVANEALNNIINGYDRALNQFNVMGSASDTMADQLSAAREKLKRSSDAIFGAVTFGLLLPERSSITPEQVNALVPPYAESLFNGLTQSIGTLGGILADKEARRAAQVRQLITALLVGSLILIALLALIARSITRPLGVLTGASRRLAAGDLNVQVPVTTRDEVGVLTRSFNLATEQLRENAARVEQERVEAQRLQGHISEFLDVTMDIAEGDLTRRGTVTEDVLGNVVDSINLMAGELAGVLGNVQRASHSVTSGSQALLSTTAQIDEGTRLTAAEAARVADRAQLITAAIREMAQQAQASAETARAALKASQQGQEAVTGTLDGMQNIRREVQGVAKRIKGLGDRSLEIQDIVDTISQIARQTNLLALNASIEAAGAGEAGGRFSIVADEVRKLADTSSQATARIATLIKNVQAEIQDVVVSVEDGTREVEQGYRVAGTAGERLREIGTLTQQSAQLAETIAGSSQAQVTGVEEMGSAVEQIAAVARQSRGSVERGRAAAEQLEQLAQGLTASLTRFRLPS